LILTIVQLLNGFIGCGVCLHSLKALSDVVERLALYPPYHGCHSRVVSIPNTNATELSQPMHLLRTLLKNYTC